MIGIIGPKKIAEIIAALALSTTQFGLIVGVVSFI
jgi:hypothetical protein